jgi:hypothetical protein
MKNHQISVNRSAGEVRCFYFYCQRLATFLILLLIFVLILPARLWATNGGITIKKTIKITIKITIKNPSHALPPTFSNHA